MPRWCAAPTASASGMRDLQQLVERHALPRDDLGQRLADHQLHRQEGHAVLLVDGIDRDDVGVVQRGNRPRLALEAAAALRIVRRGLGQDLQRDAATELAVLGQQDLAHAACAEGADDPVGAEIRRDHGTAELGTPGAAAATPRGTSQELTRISG